jgi:hypothetical protein
MEVFSATVFGRMWMGHHWLGRSGGGFKCIDVLPMYLLLSLLLLLLLLLMLLMLARWRLKTWCTCVAGAIVRLG